MAKKKSASPYSLHPGVAMMQQWIASLPAKTGNTLAQWVKIIRKDGPDDDKACAAWLKSAQGFGTNEANWLVKKAFAKDLGLADDDPDSYMDAAPRLVDNMYSGAKAALRPLYEELLQIGLAMAPDVKACPCATIVPLYRNHVFAQIKPSTNKRIDLGLALKDTKTPARLIDTGGFAKKDRITRRIPISSADEIDAELRKWLRTAYDMDA